MLKSSPNDCMEERLGAMGNEIDRDHMPFGPLAVILRELAKRAFGRAAPGQDTALQNDFGRHLSCI
jgi:hypothetical protein